jgi:hypothetical protein
VDVQEEACELQIVRTPSDNANVQCHIKLGDGNKGGSGGATVDTRVDLEGDVPARAHPVAL